MSEEGALLTAIAASPGISVRELTRSLKCRPETVVRLTQRLVERGEVERKPLMRKRSDGRQHTYPGLYAATAPLASVEPTPTSAIATPAEDRGPTEAKAPRELNPAREQLRELGERLGWGRLPITQARGFGGGVRFGRAIQGGEDGWRIALEKLPDEDIEAALSAGRHLLTLLGIAAPVVV